MSRLADDDDSEGHALLDHHGYDEDVEDFPNSRIRSSHPVHNYPGSNSRSISGRFNPDDPWAVFHQPTPSPYSRTALLVFIGLMLWLGFRMRATLGEIGGVVE
ncbi:hypothetical protein D9758_014220 [Tetrapyrgos nigripes]|uniref:Uncharacterized protein n=1 Tax=Tetrapyrgos nigripes TaxID=182062 RepID=A0A8H5FU93_9AGAR|nr:hypothetical protein D9758_014220 [Tetrapyrgos nigripes]